jgi:plasmid stabilization system protein ParE
MGRRARQRPCRAMPDAYSVALSPGALSDLDRLDSFLREKNAPAADRMLTMFNTAFAHLSENPFDSPVIPTSALRARIARFGKASYVCLYQVQEHNIVVARLFHAREDWQAWDASASD